MATWPPWWSSPASDTGPRARRPGGGPGARSALLAAARANEPDAARPDRLLSVDEAAKLLGIGRSALYGELAAGRLRSVKVGRRRLVPSGAIAEYVSRDGR
ncbi:MAG: excisionase family DNA-binding protein [Chloroflexi bacterium]|nr:excisionase family DNA-binding protein [Chloroflexota bacterium]